MLLSILLLSAGLLILLWSTRLFVIQAENASRSLRLSPLIIGTTLVAIGTSMPELAVSVTAAVRGDYGLALGNIIGSNILNILLVFSVGLLSGRIRIGTTKTPRNIFLLLLFTTLFSLQAHSPVSRFPPGLILLLLAVIFTGLEYFWGLAGRKKEDRARLQLKHYPRFKWPPLVFSLATIFVAGYITVIQVENISLLTGLSTTFFGLTLTAIATSLPELVTTLFSQNDHQDKLTAGNIIGSNIYNLLLIGGLVLLLTPRPFVRILPLTHSVCSQRPGHTQIFCFDFHLTGPALLIYYLPVISFPCLNAPSF